MFNIYSKLSIAFMVFAIIFSNQSIAQDECPDSEVTILSTDSYGDGMYSDDTVVVGDVTHTLHLISIVHQLILVLRHHLLSVWIFHHVLLFLLFKAFWIPLDW